MSARVAMLLAAPFVLVAFAMRLGVALWLQPFTWRVDSFILGLLAFLGLLAISVGIPLAGYLQLTRAARQSPRGWRCDVQHRRFAAGPSPVSTGPWAIVLGWMAGGVFPTERVPNEEHMRIAQLGFMTPVWIGLAVGLLLLAELGLLMGRPRLSLDAEGITVQRLRNVRIRWDELLPGGPPPPAERNPRTLVVYTFSPIPGDRRSRDRCLHASSMSTRRS
ncbi:hypothetical protein COUCH_11495 [Couchioplanes caeruleus]|uniref:hypothetical protein n=1 Tax=Couchioplanes caeruleus TaxID=56438 RepID=UPI0020BEBBEE|nr:hypothetical protein [Couchioplanes caeruleus]UQU66846.1 hypothetical protein COUCH_11495 [Couchioplanes caeruleus]